MCNQTQQGITIHKRTELGTIQLVQSITPLSFEEKENDSQRSMAEEASSGTYGTVMESLVFRTKFVKV